MFYSNIEYLGITDSDNQIHHILPGEEKTIPFSIQGIFEEEEKATLTTQYGFSIPLENQIRDGRGIPIFETEVSRNDHYEDSSLDFIESDYDFNQDVLKLTFSNPHDYDMVTFAEIEIGKNTWTSKLYEISAGNKGSIIIRTPYTDEIELSEKFFNVTTYYGEIDTLNSQGNEIYIEEYTEGISLRIWIYLIIILLISGFFFWFFNKRKRRRRY